jgi:hypothetical protein
MTRVRLAAAFLGLALAVAAIARDDRRIAWVAMIVLAAALALRFAARRSSKR